MSVIEFENVSKTFSHTGGAKLLGAHLRERFKRQKREVFYALRDVSFRVEAGHSMGIVGGNGAGKSTLLSLVAGLSRPNEGRVAVNGKVAALLELGSGFHPDLTGRENVRLNASLLGLSRQRTEECFESVLEFSGIGDFIEEPIRTYSSGMVMRLAFSVAVNVDPDILIVDEVLAVGDQNFQAKCYERICGFKNAGKTLLFVSHTAETVRQLCDQALWLDHGKAMMFGSPEEVLSAYSNREG
jgi:lipopolysaccharide transport system ATP-binding protein